MLRQIPNMYSYIIDSSHYAIHCISVTYLFCKYKLVPLNTLHSLCRPSTSLATSNHHYVLYIYEFCFFLFLDSKYKWGHIVWLTSLSILSILKIHPRFCKGQDLVLFYSWVFYCMCMHISHLLYPFILQWILRLFP